MEISNIQGLPNMSVKTIEFACIENEAYNDLLYRYKGFDYVNWRQDHQQIQKYSKVKNLESVPEGVNYLRIGKIRRNLLKYFAMHKYPRIHMLIKRTPILYIRGDRGYIAQDGDTFYILMGVSLSKSEKAIVYLHELGHLLSFQVFNQRHDSYEENEFLAYKRSVVLARAVGLDRSMINDLILLRRKALELSCFEINLFLHPEWFKTEEEKNDLFEIVSDCRDEQLDPSRWLYEVDLIKHPFLWSSIYYSSSRALCEILQEERDE